jgi:Mg2+-importing ATPase
VNDKAATEHFWSLPADKLAVGLGSSTQGLSAAEGARRRDLFRDRRLETRQRTGEVRLLAGQFKSPIVLLLVLAAGLSLFLHDSTDAMIVLGIVLASALLGFWQERGAARAVSRLLALVQVKVPVLRDGDPVEIPVEEVVPGDVVVLAAGATVPGDCRLLEARDLFIDEAALTGETFPVDKNPGVVSADSPLAGRTNSMFMGTHVVSGTGRALVVHTGRDTEFGQISAHLRLRPPLTEFERGVRRFGVFLLEITLVMVIAIFAFNIFFKRHVLDSIMFSLALAVGLTPQLLPAIISVNLAHGATRMAQARVIVKRLASIENFGSMNVLCSDKTGTVTEGKVAIHSTLDAAGNPSERVLFLAYLNSALESGFANPIDEAVRRHRQLDLSGYRKKDELPYDFLRKRLSIRVEPAGGSSGGQPRRDLMVTKGAFASILDVCATVEGAGGKTAPLKQVRSELERRFSELSRMGFRVLGVAARTLDPDEAFGREQEREMSFAGFLVLHDPPKAQAAETIAELGRLGVALKMITGDNRLVAATVAEQVGLDSRRLLTGSQLRSMGDEALRARAGETAVFAEVEPNQKERIILALKKAGNVVGYVGDGINDASALHAADVGISVDGAADVAKASADLVLLDKDLSVLLRGVQEGRRTFANTMKYVFMATGANFGNMFSMAGASLFLPFLPLLPKQILLTNLLTDVPEMTIATDSVDREMMEAPRRWNVGAIRRFMLLFGTLSSVFDYITFAFILLALKAPMEQFRTAWFVESVVSAALIVLVIRTRRPLVKSRPSFQLLTATLAAAAAAVALPFFTPAARILGFVPLPWVFLPVIAGIVLLYLVAAELLKRPFFARADQSPSIEAGEKRRGRLPGAGAVR